MPLVGDVSSAAVMSASGAMNTVPAKMSAAAMHHQGNKLVWIKRLMDDANFVQAVQNQSVKDAAQVAVDLLIVRFLPVSTATQPQHTRAPSPGLPGLYVVPNFKPNDRVRLKGAPPASAGLDDDRPGQRMFGLRTAPPPPLEGRVLHVAPPVAAGKPALVRVRWSNGHEMDHSPGDIELLRHIDIAEMAKNEAPLLRNNSKLKVRINGGTNGQAFKKQVLTPRSRDIIKRVKRELAELETALPWHMVDDSWKQRRNGWRNKLKSGEAAVLLSQCLKELLGVLKIQTDMPNVLLRMTQEDFVSNLDEVAGSQAAHAPMELSRLWDQIKSELYSWMHIKDEKHDKKQQHVHLAHTLHALDACRARGMQAYYQVPINRILASPSERNMLKLALLNEYSACEAKLAALEATASAPSMDGITYDLDGLGGSYGGLPRCGRSMLEGVLHFDSDVDTELDYGSEATDLADSYLGDSEPAGKLQGERSVDQEQATSAAMDVGT